MKVDFIVVHIYDYEVVSSIKFIKQFEVMIVPHIKKLYIFYECEEVPMCGETVWARTAKFKLTMMNME